jgi:GMP synthase (glutamine-hydrolysing)
MSAPSKTLKTAVVIRHIHFEDLGAFAPILAMHGYFIRYIDIGTHSLGALDPLEPGLLVVLGGPVGVYETSAYPVLEEEIQILDARLKANRPTLGICLGAQLIATTLGARVTPTGIKEIGFSELSLTEPGRKGPLRHLEGVPVLHWHGDAFEIPEGASHLAATNLCATQAFAAGPNILGLQFHPEVDATKGIEPWLIGHASELASAGIDIHTLREQAVRYGPRLKDAAGQMLDQWLEELSC